MEIKDKELHRVVSTAIIHKDGPPGGKARKYLILQRSPQKKMFPGRWTFPGGGLTVDDYINTAKSTPDAWYFAATNSLIREIKEETGLDVGKLNYLLDLAFIRPDGMPVVTLSWYCAWKSGEVKLNEENIDYRWVSFPEAKNYDLIEGVWEEIEMADRILTGEDSKKVEFNYNH